ncbi:phage holin family protein [Branchiibius sp. NY16-3462-2]|uniref:phage holin family protein n=1 Tax=Branchiibius sp. NY16-3462-2 TaxID=1807500 RepID=UPI000798FF93|nr:phage holin family protein [Branchiibius sp. NY16-3462-2]KYH42892.1 hypothetical protein AZH51_00505 [Branchiibius sp. NY16-3462-2]
MADQRSIGQMVSEVTTDLSSIVHNEIALAKLEIKSDLTKGGRGAVFLIVAAGAALYGLGFLLSAIASGIHAAGLPSWLSILIVALVLFIVAGICALIGSKHLKRIQGKPVKAIASAQETVTDLKIAAKPSNN